MFLAQHHAAMEAVMGAVMHSWSKLRMLAAAAAHAGSAVVYTQLVCCGLATKNHDTAYSTMPQLLRVEFTCCSLILVGTVTSTVHCRWLWSCFGSSCCSFSQSRSCFSSSGCCCSWSMRSSVGSSCRSRQCSSSCSGSGNR